MRLHWRHNGVEFSTACTIHSGPSLISAGKEPTVLELKTDDLSAFRSIRIGTEVSVTEEDLTIKGTVTSRDVLVANDRDPWRVRVKLKKDSLEMSSPGNSTWNQEQPVQGLVRVRSQEELDTDDLDLTQELG